jgi:hypothetical protein
MDAATREFVRQRAGDRCEYCLMPQEIDDWPFHVEHIVAKQHGGGNQKDNLCWACSRCNLNKGPNLSSVDRTNGASVQLFNPRTQSWHEHFSIAKGRIVGSTPARRATAQLLQMNDERRVELRRDLIDRGMFEN